MSSPFGLWPVAVVLALPSFGAAAESSREAHELSLVIRQLGTLETLVDRAERQARIVADQDDVRFTFDYERLRADLQRVSVGIEHYLSPSRAQPRDNELLHGQYRNERNAP